jgi:hypothetical protein
MPTQDFYPLNSNPLASSWRLAQYSFPEIPSGYCIEKASYDISLTLAAEASLFSQEIAMDRASDFIWNEWRFGLINLNSATTYPNVSIRIRDSKGRRIMNDFCAVPQCCGMVMPIIFLRGTSMYIDAIADDAGATTITFQLVFKGYKRFQP